MRALLSVFDKTGIVEFAAKLHALKVELVSSGGTAKAIAEAGIPVIDVAELTGFPAMLSHRVVTLHPKVHGGILADRNDPEHRAELEKYGIPTIDLAVVNLYPFGANPSIELIDIGGPAMVRAAAKNHKHVGVVVDPADYQSVIDELASWSSIPQDLHHSNLLTDALRRRLARKAFAHTAAYDAQIVTWFDAVDASDREYAGQPAVLPPTIHLAATLEEATRYGENPHQIGGRYSLAGKSSWWDSCVKVQGKDMSLLNIRDADAAWRMVWTLSSEPTAVIIKHANPCGVAVAADIDEAYRRAHECDPESAYGGIVAINREMSAKLAQRLVGGFTEVVVASSYAPQALAILERKPNIRVLAAPLPSESGLSIQQIDGGSGLLVQTPDRFIATVADWKVVTERLPTVSEWRDLKLAWKIAAAVTSNTIVFVKGERAVGIGAGQQNRRDAGLIASSKSHGRAEGGACASDAFFPFADGLEAVIDAGCTAVIQPGGSIRDDEVIAAANAAGMAMVFTGERHFKH